jgi:hypothetical protein
MARRFSIIGQTRTQAATVQCVTLHATRAVHLACRSISLGVRGGGLIRYRLQGVGVGQRPNSTPPQAASQGWALARDCHPDRCHRRQAGSLQIRGRSRQLQAAYIRSHGRNLEPRYLISTSQVIEKERGDPRHRNSDWLCWRAVCCLRPLSSVSPRPSQRQRG